MKFALKSFRRAGESKSLDITIIRANSSCLRMMLRQGHSEKSSCYFFDIAELKTHAESN
jgi:hypothetical protein